jgi:hypothetical protein
MKQLESNNIIFEFQHGFRENRFCESHIIFMIHLLTYNKDENIQTDLMIMNFAKAFDKVPHKRTVYKFKYYGMSQQAIHYITSFLSNRTKTVILENITSEKIPVTPGVPQGTALGPILFLIYINDLPQYIKNSQISLFADGSIIYMPIHTLTDCLKLQEDFEAAIQWEQDWLMAFHPDECNILRVTSKKKPGHFYYNIHGHMLQTVHSVKYLGITILSDLKWNKHHLKQTDPYHSFDEILK